jgi:hypothetical protein
VTNCARCASWRNARAPAAAAAFDEVARRVRARFPDLARMPALLA